MFPDVDVIIWQGVSRNFCIQITGSLFTASPCFCRLIGKVIVEHTPPLGKICADLLVMYDMLIAQHSDTPTPNHFI